MSSYAQLYTAQLGGGGSSPSALPRVHKAQPPPPGSQQGGAGQQQQQQPGQPLQRGATFKANGRDVMTHAAYGGGGAFPPMPFGAQQSPPSTGGSSSGGAGPSMHSTPIAGPYMQMSPPGTSPFQPYSSLSSTPYSASLPPSAGGNPYTPYNPYNSYPYPSQHFGAPPPPANPYFGQQYNNPSLFMPGFPPAPPPAAASTAPGNPYFAVAAAQQQQQAFMAVQQQQEQQQQQQQQQNSSQQQHQHPPPSKVKSLQPPEKSRQRQLSSAPMPQPQPAPSPVHSSPSPPAAAAAAAAPPDDGKVVRVKVVARVRPLLAHEQGRGAECIDFPSAKSLRLTMPVINAREAATAAAAAAAAAERLASSPAGSPEPLLPPLPSPSAASSSTHTTQRCFEFDRVLDPLASQQEIFDSSGVVEYIDSALAGYASTVFAYGQTGSGKTYTMSGTEQRMEAAPGEEAPPASLDDVGLIPRSIQYLFSEIQKGSDKVSASRQAAAAAAGGEGGKPGSWSLRCSYLEIYNEQLRDLLNRDSGPLQLRQNHDQGGFHCEGCVVRECFSVGDVLALANEAHRNRAVRSHALNQDSSRSHAIFMLHIEREVMVPAAAAAAPASSNSEGGAEEETPAASLSVPALRYGKLIFVDLAGSENLKQSLSTGEGRRETGAINKSLFTLGAVISLLSDMAVGRRSMQSHVPFRNSLLTKLLAESLAGRGMAMMLACLSPSQVHVQESLRTLMYAERARNIRTKPTINAALLQHSKDELIYALRRDVRQLTLENSALRSCLQQHGIPLPDFQAEMAAGSRSRGGAGGGGREERTAVKEERGGREERGGWNSSVVPGAGGGHGPHARRGSNLTGSYAAAYASASGAELDLPDNRSDAGSSSLDGGSAAGGSRPRRPSKGGGGGGRMGGSGAQAARALHSQHQTGVSSLEEAAAAASLAAAEGAEEAFALVEDLRRQLAERDAQLVSAQQLLAEYRAAEVAAPQQQQGRGSLAAGAAGAGAGAGAGSAGSTHMRSASRSQKPGGSNAALPYGVSEGSAEAAQFSGGGVSMQPLSAGASLRGGSVYSSSSSGSGHEGAPPALRVDSASRQRGGGGGGHSSSTVSPSMASRSVVGRHPSRVAGAGSISHEADMGSPERSSAAGAGAAGTLPSVLSPQPSGGSSAALSSSPSGKPGSRGGLASRGSLPSHASPSFGAMDRDLEVDVHSTPRTLLASNRALRVQVLALQHTVSLLEAGPATGAHLSDDYDAQSPNRRKAVSEIFALKKNNVRLQRQVVILQQQVREMEERERRGREEQERQRRREEDEVEEAHTPTPLRGSGASQQQSPGAPTRSLSLNIPPRGSLSHSRNRSGGNGSGEPLTASDLSPQPHLSSRLGNEGDSPRSSQLAQQRSRVQSAQREFAQQLTRAQSKPHSPPFVPSPHPATQQPGQEMPVRSRSANAPTEGTAAGAAATDKAKSKSKSKQQAQQQPPSRPPRDSPLPADQAPLAVTIQAATPRPAPVGRQGTLVTRVHSNGPSGVERTEDSEAEEEGEEEEEEEEDASEDAEVAAQLQADDAALNALSGANSPE